jgi:phosphoenolpyruvate phosphomutase
VSKRELLRELLERREIARFVGARDGLTARLVHDAGFDGLWASSFELSATQGLPDMGLLTMRECLDAAVQINRVTTLPLLADCDTGFGATINLVRTVQMFEDAGIGGVCIEDKVLPKRNSYLPGRQTLEDAQEFASRVEAAVRVRQSNDFVIVARSEAFIAGSGHDDALRRAHLYVDAGADAILVHSRRSEPSEIIEFLQAWEGRRPIVISPTTYSHWSIVDAQEAGVSMIIYANHALRASVSAIRDMLSELHLRGEASSVESWMAPVKELFDLTRVAEWEAWDL